MTAHAITPVGSVASRLRPIANRLSRIPLPYMLAAYGAVNLPFIAYAAYINLAVAPVPFDWAIFAELPDRISNGTLYTASRETGGLFRWSPVAAYVMSAILPIGYVGWTILHFWALMFIRSSRLLLIAVIASYGFWMDVTAGNAFVFVFVAAVLAWRGSSAASLVYGALFVLMPRPVQLPLLVWLLWTRPSLRVPFAAIAVVHLAAVILSGYGAAWLEVLTRTSSSEAAMGDVLNLGPSVLIGPVLSLAIGLPVAAYLTWRRQLGWAALAASPYWLAQYLLMPLAQLNVPTRDLRSSDERGEDALPRTNGVAEVDGEEGGGD
jgi:hypothetical protein